MEENNVEKIKKNNEFLKDADFQLVYIDSKIFIFERK